MKHLVTTLAACLALLVIYDDATAQSCNESIIPTTADSTLIMHGDGTVTDESTGLTWMRCSLGQVWSGDTCERSPASYVWTGAMKAAEDFAFAGHADWRLPNKNELESIVEERCFSPAVNSRAFPATPAEYFWSSSVYAGSFNAAWSVDFGYGSVNASLMSGKLHVRLVRAGRGQRGL